MSKTQFALNANDFDRLIENVNRIGTTSETVINDYIHTAGAEKIIHGITNLMPRSKKGKTHAKTSIWHEQTNYNLAVNIANSLKGKRGTSFYYLYFVDAGKGTSKAGKHKDFMAHGLNNVYDEVVNGLIEELQNNITKGL